MNSIFAAAVESLHPSLERLLGGAPVTAGQFPAAVPKQGVYLFSEVGKPLYVGRSNYIRRRYGRHCLPSATHRMAAFAFRLAREKTGRLKASYKADSDSRTGLMLDVAFSKAFSDAKQRIRNMEFRFVEEADATRQALLEIYCAIALGTPYNDFDTH